jgi:hypothetical protein
MEGYVGQAIDVKGISVAFSRDEIDMAPGKHSI